MDYDARILCQNRTGTAGQAQLYVAAGSFITYCPFSTGGNSITCGGLTSSGATFGNNNLSITDGSGQFNITPTMLRSLYTNSTSWLTSVPSTYAPLDSPAFTGSATVGGNAIITTAGGTIAGNLTLNNFHTLTCYNITLNTMDLGATVKSQGDALVLKAPIANPAFTGTATLGGYTIATSNTLLSYALLSGAVFTSFSVGVITVTNYVALPTTVTGTPSTGQLGYQKSSTQGSVALTSSPVSVASASLEPGTYILTGTAILYLGTPGQTSFVSVGISTSSTAFDTNLYTTQLQLTMGATQTYITPPTRFITVTTFTTLYLLVSSSLNTGYTCNGSDYCIIRAMRVA